MENTEPKTVSVLDILQDNSDRNIQVVIFDDEDVSSEKLLPVLNRAVKEHKACGLFNYSLECECYEDELIPCGELRSTCLLMWPSFPESKAFVDVADVMDWSFPITTKKPEYPPTIQEATAFTAGAKAALFCREHPDAPVTNPHTDPVLRELWDDGYNMVAEDDE